MASNESFAADAELARTAAIVEHATRNAKCRRCPFVGDLDCRQLCSDCAAKRLANMPKAEAATPIPETTIASLLTGPSGFAQVGGDDLCHCQSAISARTNLDTLVRRVMRAEDFLQTAPRSDSGWAVYDRAYDGLARLIATIRFHENKVRANWPDLKTDAIRIPPRLERASAPAWLSI